MGFSELLTGVRRIIPLSIHTSTNPPIPLAVLLHVYHQVVVQTRLHARPRRNPTGTPLRTPLSAPLRAPLNVPLLVHQQIAEDRAGAHSTAPIRAHPTFLVKASPRVHRHDGVQTKVNNQVEAHLTILLTPPLRAHPTVPLSAPLGCLLRSPLRIPLLVYHQITEHCRQQRFHVKLQP